MKMKEMDSQVFNFGNIVVKVGDQNWRSEVHIKHENEYIDISSLVKELQLKMDADEFRPELWLKLVNIERDLKEKSKLKKFWEWIKV